MEGNGSYNKHARVQGGLVDITSHLLNAAMARFAKQAALNSSYSIVDLGASQGRNSLQLLHHLLRHLDANLPAEIVTPELLVLHEDQPANDFATLLDTLNSHLSYIHKRPNVYTGVIAKSFYDQLEKVPSPLPGTLVFVNDPERRSLASAETLATWRQAAHDDLVKFLRLRAAELVDNGSLIVTILSDDGTLAAYKNTLVTMKCLEDMVAVGALSAASLDRMAVGLYMRTTEDFNAAIKEVPELELHEHEHVHLDFDFGTPELAVKFALSVFKPSFEAGMTEEERKSPVVQEAFHTCMTKQVEQNFHDDVLPIYRSTQAVYCNGDEVAAKLERKLVSYGDGQSCNESYLYQPKLEFVSTNNVPQHVQHTAAFLVIHLDRQAMEGKGAYNKNAVTQMGLVDLTTDLLNAAMARFVKQAELKSRYSIVDLGASQGRNSLQLFRHLIRHLDANLPVDNQPVNDFTTLLDTLNSEASYVHERPNVFTGVISKSFYERVLPSASVDIFVSYIALHWLTKVPAPLPGPVLFVDDLDVQDRIPPATLATWRQVAHEDLVKFLRLRADELVDNGSMILTFASNDGNRLSLMNMRSTTLAFEDMVAMGVLSHESLDRMVVGMYMHSKEEFIAAVAQVPELELHESQYVKLSFAFPSAEIGAKFTSAVFRPSFEAAMTDEERNDPRFQEAFNTCLAKRYSEEVDDDHTPLYKKAIGTYFYASLTRRPR
ncbi:unnamed protein product, partial [Aphanomyces euteiches]